MLAGTMLLMWIGEQITQRGIGNGISLIIFAGIVSGIPSAIGGTINLVNTGELNFLVVIGILLVILVTVGSIIYVEMGERRIPISYSRKVVLQNQHKRIMNYVPIKMNQVELFLQFLQVQLMFPSTIMQASTNPIVQAIHDFNPNSYVFNVLTFLFVIFFAYFMHLLYLMQKIFLKILKKQGGFIPGIRPGEGTALFFK